MCTECGGLQPWGSLQVWSRAGEHGKAGVEEAGYQGRAPAGAGCAFLGAGQGERSRQMQALQEMCRVKTIPGIGGVTIFIISLSGLEPPRQHPSGHVRGNFSREV